MKNITILGLGGIGATLTARAIKLLHDEMSLNIRSKTNEDLTRIQGVVIDNNSESFDKLSDSYIDLLVQINDKELEEFLPNNNITLDGDTVLERDNELREIFRENQLVIIITAASLGFGGRAALAFANYIRNIGGVKCLLLTVSPLSLEGQYRSNQARELEKKIFGKGINHLNFDCDQLCSKETLASESNLIYDDMLTRLAKMSVAIFDLFNITSVKYSNNDSAKLLKKVYGTKPTCLANYSIAAKTDNVHEMVEKHKQVLHHDFSNIRNSYNMLLSNVAHPCLGDGRLPDVIKAVEEMGSQYTERHPVVHQEIDQDKIKITSILLNDREVADRREDSMAYKDLFDKNTDRGIFEQVKLEQNQESLDSPTFLREIKITKKGDSHGSLY